MKGKVTKLILTSLLIAGTVVTATPSLSDVHALTGPEYDLSLIHIFITCTIISIVILAILYSIVYILTARTYYKIVIH